MRFPFPPQETAVEDPPEIELVNQAVTTDIAIAENPELSPLVIEQRPTSEKEIYIEELEPGEGMLKPDAQAALPPAIAAAVPLSEPDPKAEEPLRLIELPPRPMPRRKVIAFPSPSYAQTEGVRRIADPVQPEQLRILDVPEELQAMPATPFLEGLLDAPPASAPVLRRDGPELPCSTLRASRRVGAASIDAAVTLAGAGLFAAAAARFLPELPPLKFLLAGVAAISVLLWTSYQYLFLVYLGRTPGMTATRVRLQTFQGRFPNFRQRQLRVLGLYLSVLPLGMGVLWYFVDSESLCWHDRISQTFPAAADKS